MQIIPPAKTISPQNKGPQELINEVFGESKKNISKNNKKLNKIIEEETAKYLTVKSKFVKMSSERLLKMTPEPKPTHRRNKSSIVGSTNCSNKKYITSDPSILITKTIPSPKKQSVQSITIIPKLILPKTQNSTPPKVKKLTYYKTYEHSDLFDIPETNNIEKINNIDDMENIDSINNSLATNSSYSVSYSDTYSNNYTQTY